MTDATMPSNFSNESIHVKHSDLTRFNHDSMYKSECPVCENGILLFYRDQETLELLPEDRCVSCGQRVIYDDIEELRRREGSNGTVKTRPPTVC